MLLASTVAMGCSLGEIPAPQAAEVETREPLFALDALPGDSLYQLTVDAVDQTGASRTLDAHRGHPVVVSMFYAHCPVACPMLIEDVKRFEETLDPEVRADLRVVLVSLDPARDTPEVLAEAVATHSIDAARWTLLRTPPGAVREVAAALGIRYRRAPDGEMNHSSILTLLDRRGVPVARVEGLQRDAAPLRDALARLQGERRSR
ncbi:MAG: SCO family protein [Alphaproteobacteria bacterium]|nr:SCO family protein [Alphaproteobacteria bacterium]